MKLILLIGLLKELPEDVEVEVECFDSDGDVGVITINGLRTEVGIEGQVTRVVLLT